MRSHGIPSKKIFAESADPEFEGSYNRPRLAIPSISSEKFGNKSTKPTLKHPQGQAVKPVKAQIPRA